MYTGIATTPDGIGIAYQVSGEGPALVFCHAMACDQSMYDQHRNFFSHSHTLITFDQRGAGESTHPPFTEGPESHYTVDKFGDDLAAVLDALAIQRASILGYSMGAVAALSFATRFPGRVERLVLVSAMASRLPQPIIDRARQVEEILDSKGLDETYRNYFSGSLFDDLMQREDFRNLIGQAQAKATVDGFKGCFRVTIDRSSLVAELAQIQSPTLIIVGQMDSNYLAEARLLESTINNARRVVLPGVGHALAFQEPRKFEETVMSFLAESTVH